MLVFPLWKRGIEGDLPLIREAMLVFPLWEKGD